MNYYLLELLMEEKEKVKQLELEISTLNSILEPLQQKEMNRYLRKKQQSTAQNIKKWKSCAASLECDGEIEHKTAAGFDYVDK